MFTTAGGCLWPILSRKSGIFFVTLLALALTPISTHFAAGFGRAIMALIGALTAARLLRSWLPRPTVTDVHRRAVLITGCSSGLGFDAALALDAAGAIVVGACRNPQAEGPQRLKKQASERLRLVQMDVCDEASVRAAVPAVTEAVAEYGLWAIVNNAGIFASGSVEMVDMNAIHSVMETNTFGQIRVIQAFLPMLKESKGRIINMISILCRLSPAFHSPYSMSKYATLALTEALRHEVRRFGISVHSIEPWFYKTPLIINKDDRINDMWEKCPKQLKEFYGYSYVDKLKKVSDFYMGLITFESIHIPLVSDSIVDACFAKDPKMRYVPSVLAHFLIGIIQHVPYVNDTVHRLVMYLLERK